MKCYEIEQTPNYAGPYHSLPDRDYPGIRTAESRCSGIDRMIGRCQDRSVLDLGCAEGLIADRLAEYGATTVHGVDGVEARIAVARQVFADRASRRPLAYEFRAADFSDLRKFFADNQSWLLPRYDIILMLGIFHDEDEASARAILASVLEKAGDGLLFRGGIIKYPSVVETLERHGYQRFAMINYYLNGYPDGEGHVGTAPLHIYERA